MRRDDSEGRLPGAGDGTLTQHLDPAAFPMTKAALVERYGHVELPFLRPELTVDRAIAPLEETTFLSAEAVEETLRSLVGNTIARREAADDPKDAGFGGLDGVR